MKHSPPHAVEDRATERKFREGDIVLDARLDLHGMTEARAHSALRRFLEGAEATGARTVLVITGRGTNGQGVLRKNFLGWIEVLPQYPHIRTIRHASPRHGGVGAFYVVFKKKR